MAKSKRSTKKTAVATVKEHTLVCSVRTIADQVADLILTVQETQPKHAGMLNKVEDRLNKIADTLQKALTLDATKTEREATKRQKIVDQIAKLQAKLDDIK